MDLDDFTGKSCDEGKFPLINAAKDVVNGQGFSTRSTTQRTTTPRPNEQSATAAFYCVNCKFISVVSINVQMNFIVKSSRKTNLCQCF